MNFSDWLERKYIEWMAQTGKRKTLTAFAAYLGLSQPLVNQYLSGKVSTPSDESIQKIATQLGPEVYDVLGLARPDPRLKEIISRWHELSEEKQIAFLKEFQKVLPKNEKEK